MNTYAMTERWFSEVPSSLQSDPPTAERLSEQFLSFFSREFARPDVNHRAALLLSSAVGRFDHACSLEAYDIHGERRYV